MTLFIYCKMFYRVNDQKMPSRTPNIPKVWQNRIFSRTFQNEIRKEANARAETSNDQSKSELQTNICSAENKTDKLSASESSTSTANKLQSDTVRPPPSPEHKSDELTAAIAKIKPMSNEVTDDCGTLPPEVKRPDSTWTASADDDRESNISSTLSDDNARMELKIATEAQKAHSYQFDSKLKALLEEKTNSEQQIILVQTPSMTKTAAGSSNELSSKETEASTALLENDDSTTGSTNTREFVFFPLQRPASGIKPFPSSVEAKELEQASSNQLQKEKETIAEAQLAVTEAKLNVFEAKLSARQAKINERHANMCYRRALIAEAEDKLQMLESGLDALVERFQERERRVRNRERRAKQEEIRQQILESEIKKRENKITQEFKNLEKRKKLLEEKEAIFFMMNDVITEKENQLARRESNQLNRAISSENQTHKTILKEPKDDYVKTAPANQTASPPTLAKLEQPLTKRYKDPKNNWKRHSSYDGELTLKSNGNNQTTSNQTGTLPKPSKNKGIMGLWL